MDTSIQGNAKAIVFYVKTLVGPVRATCFVNCLITGSLNVEFSSYRLFKAIYWTDIILIGPFYHHFMVYVQLEVVEGDETINEA